MSERCHIDVEEGGAQRWWSAGQEADLLGPVGEKRGQPSQGRSLYSGVVESCDEGAVGDRIEGRWEVELYVHCSFPFVHDGLNVISYCDEGSFRAVVAAESRLQDA